MREKLRIAVWHNLPSGGGKRALYNHVKGLLERGHYLEAWCPDTAAQTYLPLDSLIQEHIVPLTFPDDFPTQRIYELIRDHATVQVLSEALERHAHECACQMAEKNFDVLFTNSCIFFRTTALGKYVDLPSILYLQEPYRWFYEAIPRLAWLPQNHSDLLHDEERIKGIRLQAHYEIEYARTFDLLLVNSIYSRETMLRVYNLEAKVCYLGVDTDFYTPTGEPKEDFVVGLGTIYHAKGVDRAIKALGTIPKKNRPDLVWIGNGAWPDDLKNYDALAQELDVTFIPKLNISDDKVKSLLSRAAVMVYTSRLEPFGFAPLEANACGTPVVAIAEGGVKETVIDGVNGYVVADDTPERLGEKISSLLTNKATLEKFSKISREYVESHWNLAKSTANLERFLYELQGSQQVFIEFRATLPVFVVQQGQNPTEIKQKGASISKPQQNFLRIIKSSLQKFRNYWKW